MAYRSTIRLARPLSLAVAGCLATVLFSGCSDPSVERQARFEKELTEVAAQYRKTLAEHPDLLSSNPTNESLESLRSVASKAKGLSGGTEAQTAAAAALATSVSCSAGTLALSRAAAIETQHEIVRGLAIAADSLADDLDAIAAAAGSLDLNAARAGVQGVKSSAAQSARALQTAVAGLEKPLNTATGRMSEASARLAALDQENAVLLRKARESTPAVALTFVEESAKVQGEARTARTSLSNDGIVAADLTIEKKLGEGKLAAAKGLEAAAGEALDLIGNFEGDVQANAKKTADMAKSLRTQSETLMKSVADERAELLRGSYEAAANDLANAGNARGNLARTVMAEEIRLKVTELNGLGAQGRALILMTGDKAAGLAELKTAAETSIAALKEKATAAADQLANAGEDPTVISLKAYIDGVKKSADGMTVEKLMAPPAPVAKPKAAAASSGRSSSGDAASGADDLDAVVARLNDAAADPSKGMTVMLEILDDSNPSAKAMKSIMEQSLSAMKPAIDAAIEKFGPEGAKALQGGGMGGGMGSAASLGKVTQKSNDGKKAVYSTESGQDITLVKTAGGWKLDMLSDMDPAQAAMMEQAAPMMGMMIGPMKKAAETVATKIRSGEIKTAAEVPAALQQEMMKSMGGGLGGGGGGGGGGAGRGRGR